METKKRVRALEIYKAFGKEYIYFPKGTTIKEAQMFGYRRALKKGMKVRYYVVQVQGKDIQIEAILLKINSKEERQTKHTP